MSLSVQKNIALGAKTTFGIGGNCAFFVEVNSEDELKTAVSFAQNKKLPFLIMGSGSNILVSDSGYLGLVIKMSIKGKNYQLIDDGAVLCRFKAGEVLDDVIAESVSKSYWGLENLSSIPGTVGATPVQNVGAYGVDVSDLITNVRVYDVGSNTFTNLSNSECHFAYRDSIFKTVSAKKYIITEVNVQLSVLPRPNILYPDLQKKFVDQIPTLHEIRQAIIAIRSEKFPDWNSVGTAGSFFKNPIIKATDASILSDKYPELPMYNMDNGDKKVSLGYILDKICGLKGYTKNGVALFERQALVLTAANNCRVADVINFSNEIETIVMQKTGIKIDKEVQLVE